MSDDGRAKSKAAAGRRAAFRAALAAAYLAAAAWAFVGGRGHTILLDNKSAEDGSYAAFRTVEASVNGGEVQQLSMRERVKAVAVGQRLRVKASANGRTFEGEARIPFGEDIILVSLPKLAAGIEPFWEPFRSEPAPRPAAEDEAPPSLEAAPSIGG